MKKQKLLAYCAFFLVCSLLLSGCVTFRMRHANTGWVDAVGTVYSFNEDATLITRDDGTPMYMWRNGQYWSVIIYQDKGIQPEWLVFFEENEDGTLGVWFEDDPEDVVIWTRVED